MNPSSCDSHAIVACIPTWKKILFLIDKAPIVLVDKGVVVVVVVVEDFGYDRT